MIAYRYERALLADSTHKDYIITDGTVTVSGSTYTVTGRTVLITNEYLDEESLEITRSLCSANQLAWGSCEAAMCKFTTFALNDSLVGKTLKVYVYLDGNAATIMQLGVFKVASDKLSSDRTERDIVAYDALKDIIEADMASWYNSMFPAGGSPITLGIFRAAFMSDHGLTAESRVLPNDSIIIRKTINPETLSGADVIQRICEATGTFGQITNEGKFRFVSLEKDALATLYPADDLYPSDTLYPAGAPEMQSSRYDPDEFTFESTDSQAITQLQIRNDEEDTGVIVGTSGNRYVITGNFLLFGRGGTELRTIASNILSEMEDRPYRPMRIDSALGNPTIEPGDAVKIVAGDETIVTYILQRTMTGIQDLTDTYSALGSEYCSEELNTIESQFEQLESKTLKLKADVDGVSVELEEQLDDSVVGSYAYMTQQEIELRVEKSNLLDELDDKFSTISVTSDGISFESSGSIVIDTENFKLDEEGNAEFSGSITGGTITGAAITTSGVSVGTLSLANGIIASSMGNDGIRVAGGGLNHVSGSSSVDISGGKLTASEATIYNMKLGADCSLSASGPYPLCNNRLILTQDSALDGSKVSGSVEQADYAGILGTPSRIAASVMWAYSPNPQVSPINDNIVALGSAGSRYSVVYAATGTINTSDARQKKNIQTLDDRHLRFIRALIPRSFEFIDGSSGRSHVGFVAQEVEAAMEACGLTALDFAGFIKTPVLDKDGAETGEYIYGLRYTEFIGLLTYAWQQTDVKLEALTQKLIEKGVI